MLRGFLKCAHNLEKTSVLQCTSSAQQLCALIFNHPPQIAQSEAALVVALLFSRATLLFEAVNAAC